MTKEVPVSVGGKSVDKEPVSAVVIRFQDCDPFGHLNNARYIDYFINAREDHLREHYQLDIYARQKRTRTNWVVARTRIAYLAPVVFRERVAIQTRLIHFSDKALLMEGAMLDETRKTLKAVIWIGFRHVDLSRGRGARHPGDLMALFKRICLNGVNHGCFDDRVAELAGLQPHGR